MNARRPPNPTAALTVLMKTLLLGDVVKQLPHVHVLGQGSFLPHCGRSTVCESSKLFDSAIQQIPDLCALVADSKDSVLRTSCSLGSK